MYAFDAFVLESVDVLVLKDHVVNGARLLLEELVHGIQFVLDVAKFKQRIEIFAIIGISGKLIDVAVQWVFESMVVAKFFEAKGLPFCLLGGKRNSQGIKG